MLDIKIIRNEPLECEQKLQKKDSSISIENILNLDANVRKLKTETEQLLSKKKKLSNQIFSLKSQPDASQNLMQEVEQISVQIESLKKDLLDQENLLHDLLSRLPNYPEEDVPVSPDKKGNVVIKTFGSKPTFSFEPKHHLDLNQSLQLLDFQLPAKTTGTGWPAYKNEGVLLEWALISYMLQKQISHGFTPWFPPLMVKKEILYGSGQIPKFDGQYYEVQDGDKSLYLIPTAEVVLNGFHSEEILNEQSLPLLYAAFTPCFRREAGAAGSQERGLIRIHQFHKVEMFAFTKPEDSDQVYTKMIQIAEEILEELQLHYQLSLLSTGDMSFTASKTIDVEVWLPGQKTYYEVSSISKCTDFQARRSNTRYKNKQEKLEFVHTLNGSGLATPRLMVAILENNQQADGSVIIPEVLRPYMNHQELIQPKK